MNLNINVNGTMIYVLEDNKDMLVVRNINNKPHKFLTRCDGSVGDFGKVINRLVSISDELFKDFARIQKEAENV